MSFVPEVRIEPIQEEDAFLILACDGIWDVLSDQDAVDLAMEHWQKPKDGASRRAGRAGAGDRLPVLADACGGPFSAGAAAIVRKAFKKGSEDNLTAMVIEFGWQGTAGEDTFDHGSTLSAPAVAHRSSQPIFISDGLNFDAFLATAKELEAKKAEDYAAARAKADATADDNIF